MIKIFFHDNRYGTNAEIDNSKWFTAMAEFTILTFTGMCKTLGPCTRKVVVCNKPGLTSHPLWIMEGSSAERNADCGHPKIKRFTEEKNIKKRAIVYSHHILGKNVHISYSML